MEVSDKLLVVYERLVELKSSGVKMKDIAEAIKFSPSVLSALYSTVLPIYKKTLAESSHDQALDYAISQVNNVSKRRLMSNIDDVYSDLQSYKISNYEQKVPFVDSLISEINHSEKISGNIDGIYLSYSQSSAIGRQMKVEPYLIRTSDDGKNLIVARKNTAGAVHEGFGILRENRNLYILFSESSGSFFAPVSVMLQLPFIESPSIIKGLYICLDVANNPIARRIALKKVSQRICINELEKIDSMLIDEDMLDDDQRLFFEYTCGVQDAIRMCTLPSRNFTASDLAKEKEIISIFSRE